MRRVARVVAEQLSAGGGARPAAAPAGAARRGGAYPGAPGGGGRPMAFPAAGGGGGGGGGRGRGGGGAALVAETLGDPETGVLIVDGCDFPKQGRGSVGVARQLRASKVANCRQGGGAQGGPPSDAVCRRNWFGRTIAGEPRAARRGGGGGGPGGGGGGGGAGPGGGGGGGGRGASRCTQGWLSSYRQGGGQQPQSAVRVDHPRRRYPPPSGPPGPSRRAPRGRCWRSSPSCAPSRSARRQGRTSGWLRATAPPPGQLGGDEGLSVERACRHAPGDAGLARRDALADRVGDPGVQGRAGAGPLRGARLGRLAPPHHDDPPGPPLPGPPARPGGGKGADPPRAEGARAARRERQSRPCSPTSSARTTPPIARTAATACGGSVASTAPESHVVVLDFGG